MDTSDWTNISLTPEGYIKSFKCNGVSGSLSYDNDGHLIDGVGTAISGLKLNWENGCLVSIKSYDYSESDDPYSETIYWEYGDELNTSKQYTFSTGLFYAGLAYIGLLGKGPDKLPNAYLADNLKAYISFTKNDDGTIATETYSASGASGSFNYTYGTPTNSTKKKVRTNKGSGMKLPKFTQIFGH